MHIIKKRKPLDNKKLSQNSFYVFYQFISKPGDVIAGL